jgi:hypothetical protein
MVRGLQIPGALLKVEFVDAVPAGFSPRFPSTLFKVKHLGGTPA